MANGEEVVPKGEEREKREGGEDNANDYYN